MTRVSWGLLAALVTCFVIAVRLLWQRERQRQEEKRIRAILKFKTDRLDGAETAIKNALGEYATTSEQSAVILRRLFRRSELFDTFGLQSTIQDAERSRGVNR